MISVTAVAPRPLWHDIYVSRTKCKIHVVVATCSTSVWLLPRCTLALTERHSSPVEVVLTGSGVTLLGLIEIPRSPWGHSAIDLG